MTLPALMHEVHTLSRFGVPPTTVCTVWMLGFQRRRVRRCECEILLPKPGCLPQTSQTEATRSLHWVGWSAPGATTNLPGPSSKDIRPARPEANRRHPGAVDRAVVDGATPYPARMTGTRCPPWPG